MGPYEMRSKIQELEMQLKESNAKVRKLEGLGEDFKLVCIEETSFCKAGDVLNFVDGVASFRKGWTSDFYTSKEDFFNRNRSIAERFKALDEKPNCDIIKPSYYNDSEISPFDYIRANDLDYFEGNVIKYITRYKQKNGMEDLIKCRTYLEDIISNYKEEK